jgi:hypothetical protein
MFLHCVLLSLFQWVSVKLRAVSEIIGSRKLIVCNVRSQWSRFGGLSSVIKIWNNYLICFTKPECVCFSWFSVQCLMCFTLCSILMVQFTTSPGLQQGVIERKCKSMVSCVCNCKIIGCCLISLVLISLIL